MSKQRRFISLVAITAMAFFGRLPAADAGCGCDKPPPVPAAVRPAATYAGAAVTLFHPALVVGQRYRVRFTSSAASGSQTVEAVAINRRDLADGQYKPQLVVAVPALPPGPAAIDVSGDTTGPILSLSDDAFTVTGLPVVVPPDRGEFHFPQYRAAVGRNRVTYIALDLSNVQAPMVVRAQAIGYPLRFAAADVMFYNPEGFLMQRLDGGIPGLFTIDSAAGSPDSDTLQYSRHEFSTYFLQHAERQPHAVDPADPSWHLDGSAHIDHDHLILAIAGVLDDASLPAPGATPAFDFVLETRSFFRHGVVGTDKVDVWNWSRTDSYDSRDDSIGPYDPTGVVFGSQGDVLSNQTISLDADAVIDGNATAAAFNVWGRAMITGEMTAASEPVEFLPVIIPAGLPNLGNVSLYDSMTLTLGPGSYQTSKIDLSNDARLMIDNAVGPVTLYLTGSLGIWNDAAIAVADPNPEKFAVYVQGGGAVGLSNSGSFYGVIYAPQSRIELSVGGGIFGAVVGKEIELSNTSRIHYDIALRGDAAASGPAAATPTPTARLTWTPTRTATATYTSVPPSPTRTATPVATRASTSSTGTGKTTLKGAKTSLR
jgi:hypothetical protein